MQATRYQTLPALLALTATGRGMVDHTLSQAARQAFGELMAALGAQGLLPQVRSWMALSPDRPRGANDPDCRYLAGALFGHVLHTGEGDCLQPEVALSGTLAWTALSAGRCAVFTHIGPYDTLYQTWQAIYQQWLPASGLTLRDAPPMELMRNLPGDTPPERLHTEIYLPLA